MRIPKESPVPDTESRIRLIKDVQRVAMKYGYCREAAGGKCRYPKCKCLTGVDEIIETKGDEWK